MQQRLPMRDVEAVNNSGREADAAEDLAACRALLANGSKTFFAASFLLPKRVREPATALYAFCRLADDAVDLAGAEDIEHAMPRLVERLDSAYRGQPLPIAADRAFARVVAEYDIPRAVPLALLEGFAWDAAGRRYETFEELTGYATRVAGTVGVMMALLMGVRDAGRLARACDLGIAMQLTNIARDVGEDARAGRLYLPLAWLEARGIDPDAWLRAPRFEPAIAEIVGHLLAEADRIYARAESGIRGLPTACRPGIFAARFLYAEIGREVERAELDSVTSRARVSLGRKLALLVKALGSTPLAGAIDRAAPMPAAAFLIEAAADCSPDFGAELAWWNLAARWARVVDMFDRLGRDEREAPREQVPRLAQAGSAAS